MRAGHDRRRQHDALLWMVVLVRLGRVAAAINLLQKGGRVQEGRLGADVGHS